MRIVYTELSKSQLTKIYKNLEKIIDYPEGNTRKAKQEYIKLNLEKMFPKHVVYVAKNITYFMQSKKGTPLLVSSKNQMKALVYAPRTYTVPRLHNFQCFSKKQKEEFGLEGKNGGYVKKIEVEKNTMVVEDQDTNQKEGEIFSKNKMKTISEFITVLLNKYMFEKVFIYF